MPKGKKKCPQCGGYVGVRTRVCECAYSFPVGKAKKTKQGGEVGGKTEKSSKPKAVKQTKHPLGKEYVPTPGLWVFDLPKGMPRICVPDELPIGKLTNQAVYDQCVYYGLGTCLFEFISSRKIEDKELRELWKRARKAMQNAWDYLTENDNV